MKESLPNVYNHLKRSLQRNRSDHHVGGDTLFSHHNQNNGGSQFTSSYEIIELSSPRRENGLAGSERQRNTSEVQQNPCKNNLKGYEFSPVNLDNGDDDYDYDTPYWAPSNEVKELLSQLRKLRIPSARNGDIK